jgi:hypothetical protein
LYFVHTVTRKLSGVFVRFRAPSTKKLRNFLNQQMATKPDLLDEEDGRDK